jgi:hypothetical protein
MPLIKDLAAARSLSMCSRGCTVTTDWSGDGQADRCGDRLPRPPSHQKTLPPSGPLQIRLVGAGEPVRIRPQTRVGRFLSSPQRVDVGMIGGETGRHLGTLGNGAVAGDHNIDLPDGLTQPG